MDIKKKSLLQHITCTFSNKLKRQLLFFTGQVSSYRLYNSPSVGVFYTSLNSTNLVDEIVSSKVSGRRESYRIKAVDFNKNLYYTLIAFDKSGNPGDVSNVRGAFMPAPEPEIKSIKGIAALSNEMSTGSDVIVTNQRKPDKIVVFLAVGVLSFLVLCIFSIIVIVLVHRKKKRGSSLASEENSIYGDTDDRIYGSNVNNYYQTKASIYDEQVDTISL